MEAAASPGWKFDFKGFVRSVLGILPREEACAPIRLKSDYARSKADEVLGAEDRQDLGELLELMAVDDHLWTAEASPMPRAQMRDALLGLSGTPLEVGPLERVLGASGLARAQRSHAALQEFARRFVQWLDFLEKLPGWGRLANPAERKGPQPLQGWRDTLYAPEIPLAWRQELLRALKSMAAACVIARAEEKAERLAPWLALALAEEYGQFFELVLPRMHLRALPSLVGQLFGNIVNEVRVRRAFDRWHREALAAGKAVSFPLDQPSDDSKA